MTGEVQAAVPWARGLNTLVFYELFCRLIEANMTWNNNPRPEFDRAKHSRLAQTIRAFRQERDYYPEDDSVAFGQMIIDGKSWIMDSWNFVDWLERDEDFLLGGVSEDYLDDVHPYPEDGSAFPEIVSNQAVQTGDASLDGDVEMKDVMVEGEASESSPAPTPTPAPAPAPAPMFDNLVLRFR